MRLLLAASETASEATALDIATLVIAILGLVLAVASLIWQGVTFVLSGSRAKVELLTGGLLGDGSALTWSVTQRKQSPLPKGALPIVAVQVTNSGRTEVDVIAWSLEIGGGSLVPSNEYSRPVPFRLQHGSQVTLYEEQSIIDNIVDAHIERPKSIGAVVRLGNGKTITTKERLPVPPKS